MRLYPDLPRRRVTTVAGDLSVLALLALFAWIGFAVHDAIDELASLGRGVSDAGGSVQRGLDQAADAVGAAPIVGGQLGDALRDAGASTGGEAVRLGREGEESVHSAANLLGWVTFAIPALLLLSRWLPARVAQARALTAAHRVLAAGDDEDPERRRALAQRAAFGLPYAVLARHSRDPLGDLLAGRLDPLITAAREDAGLRGPRSRHT